MSQLNIFTGSKSIEIPGLRYLPDYINHEQEAELIKTIDNNPWITDLKRRVQHYGYRYDYKSRSINSSYYLGPLPQWLQQLCNKLYEDRIFNTKPDQVIINEYIPGQGIAAHIDCIPCFTDTICSLSLGSKCNMDFTNNQAKQTIVLQSRSLLVLQKEARYQWQHSIAARKADGGVPRSRRLSLTFRKVLV